MSEYKNIKVEKNIAVFGYAVGCNVLTRLRTSTSDLNPAHIVPTEPTCIFVQPASICQIKPTEYVELISVGLPSGIKPTSTQMERRLHFTIGPLTGR